MFGEKIIALYFCFQYIHLILVVRDLNLWLSTQVQAIQLTDWLLNIEYKFNDSR